MHKYIYLFRSNHGKRTVHTNISKVLEFVLNRVRFKNLNYFNNFSNFSDMKKYTSSTVLLKKNLLI